VKYFIPCVFAFAMFGCIKAPEIVVVDRATALELQAAGSYDELEKQLAERAVSPQPVPLTPNQLEALGIMPTPLVDHTDDTDADRVDALLRQHCIGEGKDGLLVDTYDECRGSTDRVAAVALVDRTNRARVQLWRWMHSKRPDMSMDDLRRAWHEAHALGVVCRAWIQRDDDQWEAKKCEKR
jgi:hypothetical protein